MFAKLLTTSHRVHLMKALIWRVIATLTTFTLAWLITGSVTVGVAIGGAEAVTKIVLYYVHERAWWRWSKKHHIST